MTNFPDIRINGLTLWRAPLTSHETYYMAAGKNCATVDSMGLKVDPDPGHPGGGAICQMPPTPPRPGHRCQRLPAAWLLLASQ